MKKIIVLLALLLSSSLQIFSQIVIEMEENNGVYKIPCFVNGAKMKLVFDTGASKVCLSESMAEYLLENEYISKNDFHDAGSSIVADGRVVNNVGLNIKYIEIAGLVLENVDAVVIEGQTAPLLLGLSAIKKLGRIELQNNLLIINSGDAQSERMIDDLFSKASLYRKDGRYDKAKECYSKLYALDVLSDYGKYLYAEISFLTEDFRLAKKILDEIVDFEWFYTNDINVYKLMYIVHDMCGLYREAVKYGRKAYDMDIPSNQHVERTKILYDIGMILFLELNQSREASSMFSTALRCMEMKYGLREGYLIADCLGNLKRNEISYRNAIIDECAYYYFWAGADAGVFTNEQWYYSTVAMAQRGNIKARKYLNDAGISY